MTSFAAQKASWVERIARDQGITHLTFRVAYLVSVHLNRISGDAWPSQDRLAQDLGVTRRGVQLALDALVASGYLLVEVARGRGRTNRYRPIFELGNANGGSPIDGQKGEPEFAFTASKMRTTTQKNANRHSHRTLLREPSLRERGRTHDQISGRNKTTFPPNFTLTPDRIAYAKDKGFDQPKAIDMFAAFKNNHTAKGTEFADWNAGWRVWVDNEHKFRKPDDPCTSNFL